MRQSYGQMFLEQCRKHIQIVYTENRCILLYVCCLCRFLLETRFLKWLGAGEKTTRIGRVNDKNGVGMQGKRIKNFLKGFALHPTTSSYGTRDSS